MPAPARLKATLQKLRWVERVFIALLVLWVVLFFTAPGSGWIAFIQFAAFICGMWVAIRWIRVAARHAIWRLRNRLIVTYLFIGGVPILLIALLVGMTVYALASQVAVFLVTSELDRRVEDLRSAAEGIVKTDPSGRAETIRRMGDLFYQDHFPGINFILSTPAGVTRYPADAKIGPPPANTPARSGIVSLDGKFFAWAHRPFLNGSVTLLAPMGPDQLSRLVPNLGTAELLPPHPAGKDPTAKLKVEKNEFVVPKATSGNGQIPPPAFGLDVEVRFISLTAMNYYDDPEKNDRTVLYVNSRLSAVYSTLVSRKSDYLRDLFPIAFVVVSIAFLIVEIVALVAGITMTRTITRAVHRLYEGTQRIMHGDFSNRIEVKGRDQLADLGHSFNLMSERLEDLLAVAKEKERLQSEIEIAREVQSQLYPKIVPDVRSLRLTAVCKPARMVSGDYFDYECMRESLVALAIGDVAGKGISAALLMATLQSSLRTELRNTTEMAIAVGNGATSKPPSTASLVVHLNEQLYAYTSPEKYATFYLGIYDEISSTLRYTNAGHLPPILVRNGEASRLNVDGTVVGAFPFAQYDESEMQVEPGDLLVCFTDGVSEPENEYGEMFGEDRLTDLVVRNAHRTDAQIIEMIIAAVEEWTGTPELQDDMTLLLARRR